MKHAETVTFGGSGLDRAAELRSDAEAIERLMAHPDARAIPFWRGKPLISKSYPACLWRLPVSHPMLEHGVDNPVFLGCEDGAGLFTFDVSNWVPEGVDETVLGGFLDPSEQSYPGLPEDVVLA